MTSKIRAAIHGAGDVSVQHARAYLNNPRAELIAISSRREASARKLAETVGQRNVKIYTDYRRLLDDSEVDVISICTPQQLHSDEVVKAAQAGKHMIIEKPVAIDLAGLSAMRDAVRKARVKTVVSFVLRWNNVIETIKNLLSKRFFGDIFYVESDYQSHAWEPIEERWEWMRRKETGVSPFMIVGVHAIDISRWLAETRADKAANIVEVVSYSGGYRKDKSLPPFEYDVMRYTGRSGQGTLVPPLEYDGLEVAIVKFENGAVGKISTNFDAIMPYNFTWEIYGDKGTCKNNQIWSNEFIGQTDWVSLEGHLPSSAAVGAHPFQAEIDHMINCIIDDKESHANLEDAANTHETALAALISRQHGNLPVRLPLA